MALLAFALVVWLIDRDPGAPGYHWVSSWYDVTYHLHYRSYLYKRGDDYVEWMVGPGALFLVSGIVGILPGRRRSNDLPLFDVLEEVVVVESRDILD